MKDVALLVGLIFLIILAGFLHQGAPGGVYCTTLTLDLVQGNTDSKTAGEVTKLQKFLIAYQYTYSTTTTGVFDGETFSSVIDYQKVKNIQQTGVVGPDTRVAIKTDSCPKQTPPSSK